MTQTVQQRSNDRRAVLILEGGGLGKAFRLIWCPALEVD